MALKIFLTFLALIQCVCYMAKRSWGGWLLCSRLGLSGSSSHSVTLWWQNCSRFPVSGKARVNLKEERAKKKSQFQLTMFHSIFTAHATVSCVWVFLLFFFLLGRVKIKLILWKGKTGKQCSFIVRIIVSWGFRLWLLGASGSTWQNNSEQPDCSSQWG